jgi:uncharacterized protein involved in response to NO
MPVLLSYAFRPLFLLAALYAIAIVPFWVTAWLGLHPGPTTLGAPMWWHAHEMIFGFAGAAVGGFALTAVATWTKRPPVAGAPLALLVALWVVARVLLLLPFDGVLVAAATADVGYDALLFGLMSREVLGARSRRNYKVLALLGSFALVNALFFVAVATDPGWSSAVLLCAIWLLVLLINLIGGRIIPSFTANWLKRQALASGNSLRVPPPFGRLDLAATLLLTGFAVFQVMGAPAGPTAALGLATAAVFVVRLARWQGWRTSHEPLVWVLHLAFAWIPVGIALLSAAALGWVPRTAGVHALTSGAITTMIVAVASRAALGHTGRALRSHPLLTAAYVLITSAAVFRVAATVGPGARILLMVSATAWTAGFLCFVWRYAPILTLAKRPSSRSLPTV